MKLWKHFILSLILALALYPVFGLGSLFVFIGGSLIDIDHILLYFLKSGKISMKGTYDYCRSIAKTGNKRELKKTFRIFHNVEFLVILLILSTVNKIFFIISLGMISHLVMDIIYETRYFGVIHGYSLILAALKQIKGNARVKSP